MRSTCSFWHECERQLGDEGARRRPIGRVQVVEQFIEIENALGNIPDSAVVHGESAEPGAEIALLDLSSDVNAAESDDMGRMTQCSGSLIGVVDDMPERFVALEARVESEALEELVGVVDRQIEIELFENNDLTDENFIEFVRIAGGAHATRQSLSVCNRTLFDLGGEPQTSWCNETRIKINETSSDYYCVKIWNANQQFLPLSLEIESTKIDKSSSNDGLS